MRPFKPFQSQFLLHRYPQASQGMEKVMDLAVPLHNVRQFFIVDEMDLPINKS
jgi:hypothetical protein